jgi:NADH:ubiquinone oxidoreductase subunit E
MPESAPVQAPPPDLALLDPVIARHRGGGQAALLPALQETQAVYGYLPREALTALSDRLRIPLSRLYGVITFYSQFSLIPRGRHTIKCCQGTACHVRASKGVLAALREELGVEEGQTTPDLKFTLEAVRCLGACFFAPVIMVDNRYFSQMTPDRVRAVLKEFD